MKIKFFAVGGTIDKIYFDQKSKYEVGEPMIDKILTEARVNLDYDCRTILKKDSLDLTDDDRQLILNTVQADDCAHIVITHGTDTMIQSAKTLRQIKNKVIVLTGAMSPANFRYSDAFFNVGSAVGAVQTLDPGVYIAMSGRIFDPMHVKKNIDQDRFEPT